MGDSNSDNRREKMEEMSMKKTISMILAIILTLGILSGCSTISNGYNKENPILVTVWHHYNGHHQVAFEELVIKFNETVGKEAGIIVEATSKGSTVEIAEALNDSLAEKVGADSLPTIFSSYSDTVYDLTQRGVVANLDDYITEDEKNEYIEYYLHESVFEENGALMLLPVSKSTEVFYMNELVWDEFKRKTGASDDDLSTWESLAEVARKYYEYSGGQAFFGRDATANYLIVGSKQLGEELFVVENGKAEMNYNKDVMKKLWDNLYIPTIQGHYAMDGKFRSDDLKTGKIVSYVGSTSGSAFFPSNITDEDGNLTAAECGVYPLPNFSGTQPLAVCQGVGMAIIKGDQPKEHASAVFLKWLTDVEQNVEFSISSNYMPVKKDAEIINALDDLLEESPESINSSTYQTFEVTEDMMKTYALYSNQGFENSFAARATIEALFDEKICNDVIEVEKIMSEQNLTRENACKDYLTEENFNEWFEYSKAELSEIMIN